MLVLFAAAAVSSLVPAHRLLRFEQFVESHSKTANLVYASIITVFILFGAIRAVLYTTGTHDFGF